MVFPARTTYRPAWDNNDAALLHQREQLLASGRYRGIGQLSAVHFPQAGFARTNFCPLSALVKDVSALARKHRLAVDAAS